MREDEWIGALERLSSSRTLHRAVTTLNLREAEEWLHTGRLSQDDYDAFVVIWSWTAVRYTGVAGQQQESYYKSQGADKYQDMLSRRRDSVERIIGQDVL